MNDEKSKKKILMVDDDCMLLKLYEMAVESHADEFQLITAENTVDADRLARTEKPDVILLDLILGKEPGTSIDELDKLHGFNFLIALKDDEETREIPVVIFSNLDTRKDDEKARSLGAADYLVKARMLPEEVISSLRETIGIEGVKRTMSPSFNNFPKWYIITGYATRRTICHPARGTQRTAMASLFGNRSA